MHMMDEQYFQNMQFSPVRPTRQSPIEYGSDEGVLQANQMPIHQLQPQEFHQPLHPKYNYHRFSASKILGHNLNAENQPSTITVHLNLFPKTKDQQRRFGKVDKLSNIASDNRNLFSGPQKVNHFVRPQPTTTAWDTFESPHLPGEIESSTLTPNYRENP